MGVATTGVYLWSDLRPRRGSKLVSSTWSGWFESTTGTDADVKEVDVAPGPTPPLFCKRQIRQNNLNMKIATNHKPCIA